MDAIIGVLFVIIAIIVLCIIGSFASDERANAGIPAGQRRVGKGIRLKQGQQLILKPYIEKINRAMEAIHLIEQTSKIEVLLSKYTLFKQVLYDLSLMQNDELYSKALPIAINEYKANYHNRIVSETQMQFINNPYQNSISFYSKSIIQYFHRYCDEIETEIALLKREDAKIRRRESVIESAKTCIAELHNCKMTESIMYVAKDLERFDVHITFKTEDGDKPGEKMNEEVAERLKHQEIVDVVRK